MRKKQATNSDEKHISYAKNKIVLVEREFESEKVSASHFLHGKKYLFFSKKSIFKCSICENSKNFINVYFQILNPFSNIHHISCFDCTKLSEDFDQHLELRK